MTDNQIQVARNMTDVHAYMVDAMATAGDSDLPPEALIEMDIHDQAIRAVEPAHVAKSLGYEIVSAAVDLQEIVDANVTDPTMRAVATQHIANLGIQVPYLVDGVQQHSAAIQTAYALMTRLRQQRDRLAEQLQEVEGKLYYLEAQLENDGATFADLDDEQEIGDIMTMLDTDDEDVAFTVQALGRGDEADGWNALIGRLQVFYGCDEAQAAALARIGLGVSMPTGAINAARKALADEVTRRKAERA